MKITPKFQTKEEVLATRVRHVHFFSVGVGSSMRDHLTPNNAIAVLSCFFPNRRTMMAWLILRWVKGAWGDFKWWWFWTWHRTIRRRNASQIEVILDNQFRAENGGEEDGGLEDFVFDDEMEA